MDISREFTPVSKAWQIETCNELGISFVEGKVFYEPCPYLGEPTSCYKIIGDGNCLFRSIALVVSGNEELHQYFRNIITSFIAKNQKHIVNNETSEDYLNRTQMRENGVWGTNIELYFAAKFLKQQYNFSGDGQYNWWLQYLDYLQLVKNNKDTMIDYAKRGADWLIPTLMNKQKPSENSNADIDGHLFEMLDRELDDHKVVLSKAKPKKSKKNPEN